VLNLAQGVLGVDPLAGVFPGHSPYNYVMGNPISLVDPDGRMPAGGGGVNEKRDERRRQRANRKYREKVVEPLEAKWASATSNDNSLTVDDVESVLRSDANLLAKKYRKKKWMWGGDKGATSGGLGNSGNTNQRARFDPTINLDGDAPLVNFEHLEGENMEAKNLGIGELGLISAPEGLSSIAVSTGSFNVTFDGNNEPDVFSVSSGGGGASLMTGQFGGLGSTPYQGSFSGATTGGSINVGVSRVPNPTIPYSRWSLKVNFSYVKITRGSRVQNGLKDN
jgi:hypothetical protein